jgi:hypothetical protein
MTDRRAPDQPSAGSASLSAISGSTPRSPVRARPGDARPDLQAGLGPRPPRARRGELERRPPTRSAARVLPARPRPPRPPGRDRGQRPQARLPVLVSAHPRTGLRLPAALTDPQEDPPARARRRRAAPPRTAPASGPRTRRCARQSASSPNKPSWPTPAPSATGRPSHRKRARARHRGAHLKGPRRATPRGRPQTPNSLRFSSSVTRAHNPPSQKAPQPGHTT